MHKGRWCFCPALLDHQTPVILARFLSSSTGSTSALIWICSRFQESSQVWLLLCLVFQVTVTRRVLCSLSHFGPCVQRDAVSGICTSQWKLIYLCYKDIWLGESSRPVSRQLHSWSPLKPTRQLCASLESAFHLFLHDVSTSLEKMSTSLEKNVSVSTFLFCHCSSFQIFISYGLLQKSRRPANPSFPECAVFNRSLHQNTAPRRTFCDCS